MVSINNNIKDVINSFVDIDLENINNDINSNTNIPIIIHAMVEYNLHFFL